MEIKRTPYLVYLAVELHHFRRLHELLLERAAHPLPVSALPARQPLGISARPQQLRSHLNISVEEGRRRRRRRKQSDLQDEKPVRLISHVPVRCPGFDLQPLRVAALLPVERLQQARCADVHRLEGAELQPENLAEFLVIINLKKTERLFKRSA